MVLPSGRYIFTNVCWSNYAYLPNDDDRGGILSGIFHAVTDAAQWELKWSLPDRYTIKNVKYDCYASVDFHAGPGGLIFGGRGETWWKIININSSKYGEDIYRIQKIESNYVWLVDREADKAPVELNLASIHDSRSLWKITKCPEVQTVNDPPDDSGPMPHTPEPIHIESKSPPASHLHTYINDISVVYTDTAADEPSDRVMEFHGSNTDINAGFGGKYVSLVPKYTDDAAFAVTMFSVVLQGSSSPLNDYDDLAKGASGEYRYLVPVYDQNQKEKITALELFRSSKKMSDTEREEIRKCGYTGVSADINKNRRGDYLYLMWKTEITS